jgi:hypothetical protein
VYEFEASTAEQDGVYASEDRREVHGRILGYPVEPAIRIRDKPSRLAATL